ncbi:MAG TPA: TonB family protein [Blastocatellia bacterium]|jgi:TonB family protein|nr:TonB family protein [Blastocatellia bacterium]
MKPLKLALLLSSCVIALSLVTWSVIDGVARMRSAAAMADAANKFLASLTPEQKAKASFEFGDEQRFDWHFIPRDRKGLPLKDLDEKQRGLAMEFMKSGLGAAGYQKATTIMSLEPVLAQMEGPSRRFPRDPQLYYFSIFGTPSANAPWGWRVEGHHISLNFTVVKGETLSNTPLFFGANPAEVREGERKGLRALAAEEDKGRELVTALDEKQRAVAIFDKTAPGDIITMNKRKVDPLKPDGVAAGQLNKQQKAMLEKLIDEYLSRMPQDIADERSKKLRDAGFDKIYFAWAGGMNKGDPHYYRIQGPTFLVEYDDTQNNANHIHSVWRDFNGDFGEDLLREHYQATPHGTTKQSASQQDAPQEPARLRTGSRPVQGVGLGVGTGSRPVQGIGLGGGRSIEPMTASLRPKILSREKARYTDAARKAGIGGIISLRVVFGEDGAMRDIKVIKGLPFGLNEQAIAAAKNIKFEPAYRNGEPVAVRGSLEFSFNIDRPPDYWQAGAEGVGKPELINMQKPEYTDAARKNRVEGDVRLMVIFRSNGKIGQIEVIEGLPDGLTDKAIEIAKELKFKPATFSNSNKPVNVWSEVAITFKLDQ